MSSVQPEDGLPVRRVITADSFRALKLKLSGAKPPLAPHAKAENTPPVMAPSELPAVAMPAEPPAAAQAIELPDLSATRPAETEPPLAEAIPETPAAAAPDVARPVEPELPAPENAVAPEAASEPAETGAPAEVAQSPHATMPELVEPAAQEAPDETANPEISVDGTVRVPQTSSLEPPVGQTRHAEPAAVSVPVRSDTAGFVERRILETPQPEDPEAGARAHELLDIMAVPTTGSLPQERALANDTLLRLIPRMPLRSLRHLAERVCLMETPSQMLVRRLINDPRIEVSGPLLENAMTVDDSDLIAVASTGSPAKLKLMARRRIISPALSEALIRSNHVETLLNLVRNQGASFSIESMWRLTRFAAAHPVLQAPLVTRQDTPSPIAFQFFWRLPSELRRYVLSRFLTDSETITRILSMNAESEGAERKYADLSLLSKLAEATPEAAGAIYAELVQVSKDTGARIAEDQGGEALTVALKAAGLTRAQFAGIVDKRADAEALKAIFDTLSFNKARVLLTYWDWAARRTGPYARIATA